MPSSLVLTSAAHPSAAVRARRSFRRPWMTAYAFISPNLVLFSAFSFFPLLYAFYISFHDWSLIGDAEYAGLANYRRLLGDTQFWHALLNTAAYALASVPTTMAGGLLLAVALNRQLPGRVFLRSVYFLPVVVSAVATGIIAAWLFNEHYGVINSLVVRLGEGELDVGLRRRGAQRVVEELGEQAEKVPAQPRGVPELEPVGLLVQAHPQPEVGRLDAQRAFHRDHVRGDQQQPGRLHERVELAEDPVRDHREHCSGLPAERPGL